MKIIEVGNLTLFTISSRKMLDESGDGVTGRKGDTRWHSFVGTAIITLVHSDFCANQDSVSYTDRVGGTTKRTFVGLIDL